ncbi:reverse transcriptase [Plakobranchus ocellatus]|uniref:Reverse transcriptase n=1 Tax=Plakobranchus ocellatus TaxID=259542 RepID=A0AAV4C8K8_9GAST|nr:reverse transcriptase [Plakobranchus ocellatus]
MVTTRQGYGTQKPKIPLLSDPSQKPSVSFSAKTESEPYRPLARAYDKGNSRSNWPRSQRGVGRGNNPSQGHKSPISQGYSGSGRSGTSHSPSRDRNRPSSNTRSVGRGQQFRPNSSGGSGVAASRNDVICYQCGGKGLVRREGPSRQKEDYSKSKLKHFVSGDEVLVLLPTSENKLVLSFKGPYRVIEKRTSVVYLVDLGDRKCTFHVNLLRKYKRSTYASPSPSGNLDNVDNACSNQAVAAISEEDGGEIGSLITTPPLASESGTVVIDPSLSFSQVQDVKELFIEFQDILISVPGCAITLCHEIRLTTDAVIRVKPYPSPFAAREFVTQEINDLLTLGGIEPWDSPSCFPIVVVKKKVGSMRLFIDFRKLNAVTVFDAENIPRQEDLFHQLSYATIFSSYMQETFNVTSGASDFGTGAVLLQDRDGTLMPCRYASRKHLSREGRYSAIEREALALVFAVTQFERYLAFNHIIFQTDHKPLSYLRASSPKNVRLMRWALALREFSFQVVHMPGSQNVHTDVLSRLC